MGRGLAVRTKRVFKKITAIAGAALMAGVSVGAAAADLSSLSSTFITSGDFDSYVVLGTSGGSNVLGFAKDVAGSIVVASAFAQQARTTASASGSATLSRNLTTGYLNNSYLAIGASAPSAAKNWVSATDGFSWMVNSTVQNSSDHDVANVTAKLSMNPSKLTLTDEGVYQLSNQGFVYNLTFNSDQSTSGNQGVGNNTKNIPFPDGNAYQITNWTASGSSINVTLGDFTEVTATTGTVYSVGSTGATFEIMGYSDSDNTLRVKVLDSAGAQLAYDYFEGGDEIYSDDDFTLNLNEFHTPGGVIDAVLAWTTSSLKLLNGKSHSSWPNWTIRMTNDADGISSIAWEYRNQVPGYIELSPGTSLSLLDDFFNLVVEGLEINSTDELTTTVTVKDATSSSWEVSFIDENNSIHYVDLTMESGTFGSGTNNDTSFTWLDNIQWQFECIDDGTKVNITNVGQGSGSEFQVDNMTPFDINWSQGNLTGYSVTANMTWQGCKSGKFNLTVVNFTTDAGYPLNDSMVYALDDVVDTKWSNVSASAINGTLTISEPNGDEITFDWVGGDIKSDGVDTTDSSDVVPSSGDSIYTTDWGSYITRDSSSQLTVVYPDSYRIGKASVGREGVKEYTLAEDEYSSDLDVTLVSGTGESVSINNIDVGLAKLDSEVTTSSLSKPVILIGGWSVNSLVSDLVDAGSINTSDLASGRALVQLVSSAFNSQSALVIAGYSGDDTRMAAQVVASHVLGTDMGLTGSKAILNTDVSDYSSVTVI
jgi:hypothetical protein